jgi:hypothetical protein
MKFPVAAYMCHAVNPTSVYVVTLESEHVGGAGEVRQRMEALAVCHLDTSQFGAINMPENVSSQGTPRSATSFPGTASSCRLLLIPLPLLKYIFRPTGIV